MEQATPNDTASEARVPTLEAQPQRYQAALDTISEGVAFFDRDHRLILGNRPYAEIYRLAPDQLPPGTSLRQMVELRSAAGTCPMAVDDYVAFMMSVNSKREDRDWSVTLNDGRVIRVRYRPMADGGWMSTHEDVTDARERRLLIEERVSMQSLIDMVPDNLWIKDTESRFVIANRATAFRMGHPTPRELIGKSDLELCPWETAQKYLADEREVIETGRPMIDSEEYILGVDSEKLWIATTKVPFRNERGEVAGVIGVSRDITRRRLADALREGQFGILELIAAGVPAQSVLEELVHLLESQSSGSVALIMLLADDADQPRTEAAIRREITGRRAELFEGPLRQAICDSDLVIVPDIGADRSWVDHWAFFSAHNLRACWATPISSRSGSPLGALAIFARSAREPNEAELKLMHVGGHLAALAIEREGAKVSA